MGGVGVVTLVAASTLALRGTSHSHATDTAQLTAIEPRARATTAVVDGEIGRPWPIGIQRTYALDFGSASRTGSESSQRGVFGTGKLSLVAQTTDEHGATLKGSFSELAFVRPDDAAPAEDVGPADPQRLAAELARPFLVFMTRAGAVESISVDPALGDGALAFVRGFLATLQFVEPGGPNPTWDRWTAVETDNFGVCAARYERIGDDRFKKTKADYRHLEMTDKLQSADGTQPKDAPRVSSEAVIDLVRGIVRKAAMVERVTAALDDVSIQTESHLTLELADTRRVQVDPLTPNGWKRERLSATRDPSPEERRESLRRVLGNATFRDLLAAITELGKASSTASQRWDVVDRLVALFQLHPESLREALLALQGRLRREDAEVLLAAIGNTKTPDSQAALGALAGSSAVEGDLRRNAVMRLALDEGPTEATLAALDRLAKSNDDASLRDTALLALGGAARHASSADVTSRAAKQAIRELEADAAAADGVERRTLLLSALGNTGSRDVLATLRRALADPDPRIRSAAANALRLVPGSEVDALLAAVAARDVEPLVRRSAVDTLGLRVFEASVFDVLSTSLRSDPDALVRLGVVSVLAARIASSPVARAALDWAATRDLDVEVRKAAARAVDPNPGKRG